MREIQDFIVIGAGAAGLSISALLSKEKAHYLLLESHSLLGGCASYFVKGGYSFDVGATTLSGLEKGRPLSNFLKRIDLELETLKVDPGIISVIDHKKIFHYSDVEKKRQNYLENFPQINVNELDHFLRELYKIESSAYGALEINQLPIRATSDVLKLIQLQNLSHLPFILLLNQSFQTWLRSKISAGHTFEKMFNEILFITAQNNLKSTPALLGILGANYSSDTHYHLGGMQGFIRKLQSKVENVKINHRVIKISFEKGIYKVETNKGVFYSENIISTLPRENNLKLLGEPVTTDKENYSAFTLYFTIPQRELESLYYQIHCEQIPKCNTESYFVSFSHPNDLSRNKNNRMTVTISTHLLPSVFKNLSKENYLYSKNEVTQFILKNFCHQFNLSLDQIDHLESGTSLTFERYTNRFQGSVGGKGHHLGKIYQQLYQPELRKNFYEIGDNFFPGQGIAAVISGAVSLKDFLYR